MTANPKLSSFTEWILLVLEAISQRSHGVIHKPQAKDMTVISGEHREAYKSGTMVCVAGTKC